MNAKKATIKGEQALTLLRDVDDLYAAKGKRVVHLDLRKTKPPKAELLALMLGPTGNLRAPTMRVGDTIYVGFPKDGFEGLR